MFRQHTRVAGAYRVTFSPEAWKEIGRLSSGTFQALQEALEQLAQQSKPGTADSASTSLTFSIDSLIIHCERDDQSRTLILQHVFPAPRGPEL
ncbi:type II toxin-antitoxin system RelE family toxin [Hyalangium versicolor]|uniref:type II toxin-antitoxin system RelE family toxin n=1 Tax=Hyalangium versicolor TaxID=2861190 RepID=UPI001CCD8C0D|nr:hypothetical protein [Hyalangium versicolor]